MVYADYLCQLQMLLFSLNFLVMTLMCALILLNNEHIGLSPDSPTPPPLKNSPSEKETSIIG